MQKPQIYCQRHSFRKPIVKVKKAIKYTLLSLIFLSPLTHSFAPLGNISKLIRPKHYEASGYIQFLNQKKGTDVNLIAQFSHGYKRQDINLQYQIAGGESGVGIASFLKWVPFPDYKYQPAVGVAVGVGYDLYDLKIHSLNLYLRPFLTKEFPTVIGKLNPYLALPLGFKYKIQAKTDFPIRIVFGVRGELFFIHFHKIEIDIELSTRLNRSNATSYSSYISLGFIAQLM